MKTFKILFAAIIFVGFTSSAMAQTGVDATQNVNAYAAIIADIDISKTSDVNFGVVDLDQTHTIDADTEEITENAGLGGNWSFGEIEVSATENVEFNVTWDDNIELTNTSGSGNETMSFTPEFIHDGTVYTKEEYISAAEGNDVFKIGGDLEVASDQAVGQYETAFTVTAEYN